MAEWPAPLDSRPRWCETYGMLQLSQLLQNRPVMSLRTGKPIATAGAVIINPNNLKIEGWHCKDRFSKKKGFILQAQEIRDIIPQGIVVNDHDALSDAADLVRLQSVVKLNFDLAGKPVYSASGKKLGKVNDWAAESSSLMIQKLYVSQSLIKHIGGGDLSIDRSQIVEITNRKIVVAEPTVTEKSAVPAAAPAT